MYRRFVNKDSQLDAVLKQRKERIKGLKYTIIHTPTVIQKGLEYAVDVSITHAIQKGLEYAIVAISVSITITKKMQYWIKGQKWYDPDTKDWQDDATENWYNDNSSSWKTDH